MAETICVEVAYALADQQWLVSVQLPAGSTAHDALLASGLLAQLKLSEPFEFGVFGRRCSAQTVVQEGDRVEIYRPLSFDPMESRRRRAAKAGKR